MHVARLQISGVRSFSGDRSVDLNFARPDGSLAGWTVLAGRNASGKSTLLQALALLFAGPRSTGFIPSLVDWMSNGIARAEMQASVQMADLDAFEPTLFEPDMERRVWMRFEKPQHVDGGQDPIEPKFSGVGLDSSARAGGFSSVESGAFRCFYVGYGPFRHIDNVAARNRRVSLSKLALQVASLFDASVSLADSVDWLIEQHLYRLEHRPGAEGFLDLTMKLLGDGLIPDGFRISRVDSDGLWIANDNSQFPLRVMSDGYRIVASLVVDIMRQMNTSFRELKIEYRNGIPTLPYPGVVLIDEVEAHLHVSWQKTIGRWLKEHFPEVQFIVTTHSPYICQSADPGGIIRLPGPGEHGSPHTIDDDLYERVVYGSGDDAVLSELFGVSTPYSVEAERLRRHLGDLEIKVLDGSASPSEKDEYKRLSAMLTSSLTARADEVAARLGRER
jgi:putative AbiEii toxin of type IV toxin-antitoxin system/AAA domain-containing protein